MTKEVFWIFLHHLNVIALPASPSAPASASASTPLSDDLNSLTPPTPPAPEKEGMEKESYATRHFPRARAPVPAAPYIGGVEWDATTYLTAHLDLLNALIASLPTCADRNALRAELAASGWEKVMGGTLRTCKEKFYGGVHDGLRGWVGAAGEDGWGVRVVREGLSSAEERARSRSPKKGEAPAPKLDLDLGFEAKGGKEEGGWLL